MVVCMGSNVWPNCWGPSCLCFTNGASLVNLEKSLSLIFCMVIGAPFKLDNTIYGNLIWQYIQHIVICKNRNELDYHCGLIKL